MKKCFLVFLLIKFDCILAQDSSFSKNQFEWKGYVKEMYRLQSDQYGNNSIIALTHNRMNVTWKHDTTLTGKFELRTRWFFGDDPVGSPEFTTMLKNKNDFLRLSATVFNQNNTCLFTNIERLSLEYRKKKWDVRVGRQRINWGMNNFWNPNDIFNTGNYFDFDYEEKPGADACKVQLSHRNFSHTDFAVSMSGNKPVMGLRYFTNYRKYDLQFLAGTYKNIFTAGFGWAGHIADAGFKGEVQFFDDRPEQKAHISTEFDYVFRKGWYLSIGFLFNDMKKLNNGLTGSLTDFEVTPMTLMPARYSYIIAAKKDITPLLKTSFSGLYLQSPEMYMLSADISYELSPDLDFDLISQQVFSGNNGIDNGQTVLFVRLKYSF